MEIYIRTLEEIEFVEVVVVIVEVKLGHFNTSKLWKVAFITSIVTFKPKSIIRVL